MLTELSTDVRDAIGSELCAVADNDFELFRKAVSLLIDIIEHRKSYIGDWTKEFYEIGEGHDFIPGRPHFHDAHVQLLIQTRTLQWSSAYSGLRILTSKEQRVQEIINAYVRSLEHVQAETKEAKPC